MKIMLSGVDDKSIIAVKDNGVGFGDINPSLLFKRFYRTDFSWPGHPVTPSSSRTTALPAPARSFCRRASRLAVPRGTGQFSGIFASDSVQ